MPTFSETLRDVSDQLLLQRISDLSAQRYAASDLETRTINGEIRRVSSAAHYLGISAVLTAEAQR